jgi:two-component SAPR family response regulator
MPGIHGPDLAARVRAQRSQIGVVFMSGYAQDVVGHDGQLSVQGEFLPKPFTMDGLSRAVARAAETNHGGPSTVDIGGGPAQSEVEAALPARTLAKRR